MHVNKCTTNRKSPPTKWLKYKQLAIVNLPFEGHNLCVNKYMQYQWKITFLLWKNNIDNATVSFNLPLKMTIFCTVTRSANGSPEEVQAHQYSLVISINGLLSVAPKNYNIQNLLQFTHLIYKNLRSGTIQHIFLVYHHSVLTNYLDLTWICKIVLSSHIHLN